MTKPDRYLQTETVRAKLGQRSLRSGFASVAAQPLKLVVGIGGTMVLARLLQPADFGLLAMVQPLLSIVDGLSNMGLETATVQHQDLDRDRASAVFWLSLKINAIAIGGMVLCGPLLARFYGRPELTNIVFCLAVGVASLCLSFQHTSLLKRQMQFEILTAIEVTALTVSTAIAIGIAWLGWGYWALILQLTTLQIVKGVAAWMFCGWRPHRPAKSSPGKADEPSPPKIARAAKLAHPAHAPQFAGQVLMIVRIGIHFAVALAQKDNVIEGLDSRIEAIAPALGKDDFKAMARQIGRDLSSSDTRAYHYDLRFKVCLFA